MHACMGKKFQSYTYLMPLIPEYDPPFSSFKVSVHPFSNTDMHMGGIVSIQADVISSITPVTGN